SAPPRVLAGVPGLLRRRWRRRGDLRRPVLGRRRLGGRVAATGRGGVLDAGLVLHAVRGELHERLLQRGPVLGQLVQPDAGVVGDVTDLVGGQPLDDQGVGLAGGRGATGGGG